MGKNKLKKTEVIAEIANAHQGSAETAFKLALASYNSGADAIKFQIYFAEEMLNKDHKRYDHFKNQSFNHKTWDYLIQRLKKKKIKIYCDIFGVKAFKVARKNNVDGYKIHSSDLNNIRLLNLIKKTKKKIFLSAGGSTLNEIAFAVNVLNKNKIKPILLHGFQSYPTKVENSDLGKINFFRKIFNNKCDYGYQDHISADNKFNYISPLIAIGQGANYLEKHVTFNRELKGVDYYSSLEPNELKEFINLVKQSDKSFNESHYSFFDDEIKYRNQVKKIWFSTKNLKKNKKLKIEDLEMRRPKNNNLHPINIEKLLGKKLLKNLKSDTPMNRSITKNHITALIVARSKSKRLPNKATKKICGFSTIEHLIKRVKKSKKINKIILCTTTNAEDKKIADIAKKNNINFFRGANDDVLKRMLDAIKKINTDIVVRITGDDILIDPEYLDLNLDFHIEKNLEYSNNKDLPSGCEVEIFDVELLKKIQFLAKDTSGTEYLTFYLEKYKNQFTTGSLPIPKRFKKNLRLTIDNKNDFRVVKKFLEEMHKQKKLFDYNLSDIANFSKRNKKLFKKLKVNKKIEINTEFNWQKIVS